MDCKITEVYFREKAKMTQLCCANFCWDCPLSEDNNGYNVTCGEFELEHPKEAIEIVQKWSDENAVTMLEDFKSKYPDAELNENGIPCNLCPQALGYEKVKYCETVWHRYEYDHCVECWNRRI